MTAPRALYEIGEIPPVGHVPREMYAQVIRPERFGEPMKAFQVEKVPVPELAADEVLVCVMAAGINYNNVWASLGVPVDVVKVHARGGDTTGFHIGGSDASGVVYAVGKDVTTHKVGDEVVIHCGVWDRNDPVVKSGQDPMFAPSFQIWSCSVRSFEIRIFRRWLDHAGGRKLDAGAFDQPVRVESRS